MKLKLQEKQKAIKLRKEGFSYSEIQKEIPVTKSTLSSWLKYLKITPEQEKRLENKAKEARDKGRLKTALKNRELRKIREKKDINQAKKEFKRYRNDDLFTFGITMYWAEGSKKSPGFDFTNSDPEIIKLIMKWIIKYFNLPKEKIDIRLYIHKPYEHENCEKFWSNITGVPVSKFKKTVYKYTPHNFKRNPEYKGCLKIRVGQIKYYRKVMAWQKLISSHILGKNNKC